MSKEPTRPADKEEQKQQVEAKRPETDDAERRRLLEEKPFDYIERTRPEDPSGRPGQLTRDNVNPNIPSGKPGDPPNSGGIVDPTSLGMPQGGVAPKEAQPLPEGELPRTESINEPPGSNVYGVAVPEGLGAPVVNSLDPEECTIGDQSFDLEVHGENFFAGSVIVFAGHDEPTTYDETAGTLSTGVDMSVWHGPDTVKVSVRNGSVKSNEVDFTFLDGGAARDADPDDLEEEIDEAVESGEAKSISAAKPKRKR
jgi:hypothetical protein